MKLALIGLPNSGKTTVFNALTGLNLETTLYPTTAGEPHIGIVKVPDGRVDELSRIFKPRKTTYATVEYVDFLGITKGDLAQNRKVFDVIKDADALVHIIRGFHDDAISHPDGSVDPIRDVETVETELIFSDLELVEKRLQRMEEGIKRGKKPDESEKRVLMKCREYLEKEIPLRLAVFDAEELRSMKHLQFISILPVINGVNVAESDLTKAVSSTIADKLHKSLQKHPHLNVVPPIILSGKIEMEIAQLPSDEAAEFLKDLGISEPARDRLIRESYSLLGLVSFFTVGEDEVRAWTIRKGTFALTAAGKIHSDIERGFIRAEVISYPDFIRSGSMAAAKQHGLLRLEGKNYIVRDGDIINFRFNV
ncbi:MAG: redox-regulated ATPase YchF [bacterium]